MDLLGTAMTVIGQIAAVCSGFSYRYGLDEKIDGINPSLPEEGSVDLGRDGFTPSTGLLVGASFQLPEEITIRNRIMSMSGFKSHTRRNKVQW